MKSHPANVASLIGMVACCTVLLLLIPQQVLRRRAAARSIQCSNQLKQVGLAMHNYHSAYKQLPSGTGGTTGNDNRALSNQGQLSPLVPLLPFCEHIELWDAIVNPYQNPTTGQQFPSMGPVPTYSAKAYRPWAQGPDLFRCPDSYERVADKNPQVVQSLNLPVGSGGTGVTASYVACFGDGTVMQGEIIQGKLNAVQIRNRNAANRGMFATNQELRFRDVLDGLSYTMAFSEVVERLRREPGVSEIIKDVHGLSKNPSLCIKAAQGTPEFWPFGRGARWSSGMPVLMGFQSVLPPNSVSCTSENGMMEPIVSASSLHAGGVHVLFGDGAVKFISETINSGDSSSPGVAALPGYTRPGERSPYGLWGALGTRGSGERVSQQVDEMQVMPRPSFRSSRSNTKAFTGTRWTDLSTQDSLVAEFIEIKNKNTIRLRSRTGTIHEVPLNSLEPQDIYRAVQLDVMQRSNKKQ